MKICLFKIKNEDKLCLDFFFLQDNLYLVRVCTHFTQPKYSIHISPNLSIVLPTKFKEAVRDRSDIAQHRVVHCIKKSKIVPILFRDIITILFK